MEKIGSLSERCWTGYKPVPGKKPYSKGSCAPVGKVTKKSKKEMKEGYGELGGEPSDDEKKILAANDKKRAEKKKGEIKKEASDEDRMRAAQEDEERMRKLKGKKPTPKALRRVPGTDEYVK